MKAKEFITGVSLGNANMKISLLQFVDDTIFFKESPRECITLKTILRCFELASGLKVNFHKSSLASINVKNRVISRKSWLWMWM